MAKKISESTFRVRYAETDASGMVYHANYIIWFEHGRSDWFWQQGRDYHRDVETRGLGWPVTELAARYLAPARYGDLITVRTWFEQMHSRGMTIAYQVLNAETKQLLCTGWTKHLNVDAQGRVVRIPEDIRAIIEGKE